MTLENAIKTAIEYEKKIRDLYQQATEDISDESGKKLVQSLAEDEQRHVDYLEHQLNQWRDSGKIDVDKLPEAKINADDLTKNVEQVAEGLLQKDNDLEQQLLSKALKAELATSEFYSEMVGTLPENERVLFQRFLEIEKDHVEIVQAQLDYLMNTGYWFGIKEFDME